MKAQAFTDEELLAKLLELHNRDRWPGATLGLPDSPMRRALRKKGWIETFQKLNSHYSRVWRWRISAAGREMLVNLSGSGVIRGDPLKIRPGKPTGG